MTDSTHSSHDEATLELLEIIDQQSRTIEHLLQEVQRLRGERAAWDHEQRGALVTFRDFILGMNGGHGDHH
jgi:hypothetical protein